jgi:hypothetical protein
MIQEVLLYAAQNLLTEFEWAERDQYNSRRAAADRPPVWFHHDSSEPVTKGWNNCIKMGDNESLKS